MKRLLIVFLFLVACSVEPEFDPVLKRIESGEGALKVFDASPERGAYIYQIASCAACHNAQKFEKLEIRSTHDAYSWMSDSDMASLAIYLGVAPGSGKGAYPEPTTTYGPYIYRGLVGCQNCHGDDVAEDMSVGELVKHLRSGDKNCSGVGKPYLETDLEALATYLVSID